MNANHVVLVVSLNDTLLSLLDGGAVKRRIVGRVANHEAVGAQSLGVGSVFFHKTSVLLDKNVDLSTKSHVLLVGVVSLLLEGLGESEVLLDRCRGARVLCRARGLYLHRRTVDGVSIAEVTFNVLDSRTTEDSVAW